MLTSSVKFPGSATKNWMKVMHTSMINKYISIDREYQKLLLDSTQCIGLIDHEKYRKWPSKRKWSDHEYHIQGNKDVQHKEAKILCDSKKFQEFPFRGPHKKPHWVRGLSTYNHLQIDHKLGHGRCAIICTNILYKPWIIGSDSARKPHYQHVEDYTKWSMLGSFKNWNIIRFTNKTTTNDEFDAVHKLLLDGISDNMYELV